MTDNFLTESYGFVQKAVGKFAELVEALTESLLDDEIRKLIMADLGLDPDSGAQLDIPQQNLASIRAYSQNADTDLEAFLAVVDDIDQISEAITSFIEAASAEPTTGEALRELAYELLLLSSLLQMRYKHPTGFAIAEALGLIDYGLENYDLLRLLWDQVERILDTLVDLELSAFWGWKLGSAVELQTEAHARNLSDTLLLPIAAVLTALLDLKEGSSRWLDTDLLYGWDILDPAAPTFDETISDRILSTQFSAKFKGDGEKLFSIAQTFATELDNRQISTGLRNEFQTNGKTLGAQAEVVVGEAGSKWQILDNERFTIKKEEQILNVYSEPIQSEFSTGLGILIVPRDDGGPGLFLALGAGGDFTIPLSTQWSLQIKGKAPTAASLFINFDDLEASQVFGPADAGVSLAFKKKDKLLQRRAKLPDIAGSSMSFGSVEFGAELTAKKLDFRAISKNNTLIISGKSADNFIRKSLPAGEIRADFDLGLGFNITEQKFYFTDGSKLKVVLPIGKEVLGVRFVYITLEIVPKTVEDETRVSIEISGSLAIKWGPFSSAIDRIGLQVTLPPPKDEAGDLDWSEAFTFKPPTGIGFAIDGAVVSGGGFLFFDRENQEYAGVLQLAVVEKFSLKAIGLITTRLPGGEEGFSILAIASVEFSPGYSLFWGFMLQGVGLLVGVNRSMVLETLRTGVRNGTLDAILFPEDPVLNAPKLINDLRSVFPPTLDRHVFGLLLTINWAGLKNSFKIKLGVVLEVPTPVKLVILGQIKITIPNEKAGIVLIQCDIVGIWDQAAQSLSIDAALRDSKVGNFPLTGELAVRGNWGSEKVFIFAAGGVHPGFNPPAALPPLKRVQIAIGTGDNPRLRLQGYLAITANTFQVGARAELFAKASGFSLEGWAGIDALFQFDPFKFVVDFSAGVEIKRGSRVLFSLTLKGTLEGFTPLRIHGKVKFKIFFVSFSIPFHLNIGAAVETVLEAVAVLAELTAALNDRNNWAGELTGQRQMLVTLRDSQSSDELTIHPLSALVVRQQVVPLGVEIQLFKNAPPAGERKFEITGVQVNGSTANVNVVEDYFAPAQFFDLSDDEKLIRPSFEGMPAGVQVGDDAFKHGGAIASEMIYETYLIDQGQDRIVRVRDYVMSQEIFEATAVLGAAGQAGGQKTGAGKYRLPGLGIHVAEPAYVVASVDDLTPAGDDPGAGNYTQALAALRARQAAHPEEAGSLQVVGSHEKVSR